MYLVDVQLFNGFWYRLFFVGWQDAEMQCAEVQRHKRLKVQRHKGTKVQRFTGTKAPSLAQCFKVGRVMQGQCDT